MKNLFLVVLVLFIGTNLKSQITIISSDMPNAGTYLTQARDTNPAPTLPVFVSGPNISWDFTALNNLNQGGFGFVSPSSTPYGTSFPSATHCYMTADSMFAYVKTTSNYVVALGARIQIDTIDIILKYEPNDTMYVFPYTYGTTFNSYPVTEVKMFYGDSIDVGLGNVYIDSIKMTLSFTKHFVVDGWGNVITPMGSFNALRSNCNEITETTIFAKYMNMWIPINTSKDTTLKLDWYVKGTGAPLIHVEVDPASSTYTVVEWLTINSTFGFDESDNLPNIILYPNPCSDELSVRFEGETTEQLVVTDISGREIKRINSNFQHEVKIQLSDINAGIYFMRAENKDGIYAVEKFIKQ